MADTSVLPNLFSAKSVVVDDCTYLISACTTLYFTARLYQKGLLSSTATPREVPSLTVRSRIGQ